MWLFSLDIFEENQFYEIKNRNICDQGCITKVRMSKNEQ